MELYHEEKLHKLTITEENFVNDVTNQCQKLGISIEELYKKLWRMPSVEYYEKAIMLIYYGLVDVNYVGERNDKYITPHILTITIFEKRYSLDEEENKRIKLDLFRILLEMGADVHVEDKSGISFYKKLSSVLLNDSIYSKEYITLRENGIDLLEEIKEEIDFKYNFVKRK